MSPLVEDLWHCVPVAARHRLASGGHQPSLSPEVLMNREKYVMYATALVVVAALLVWAGLPPIALLLLACPVMMFFMMSGMSNMSGSRTEGAPKKPSFPPVRSTRTSTSRDASGTWLPAWPPVRSPPVLLLPAPAHRPRAHPASLAPLQGPDPGPRSAWPLTKYPRGVYPNHDSSSDLPIVGTVSQVTDRHHQRATPTLQAPRVGTRRIHDIESPQRDQPDWSGSVPLDAPGEGVVPTLGMRGVTRTGCVSCHPQHTHAHAAVPVDGGAGPGVTPPDRDRARGRARWSRRWHPGAGHEPRRPS